jgi:hypothetical protein
MLTPNQQRIVWEGWLGAETRAYYFADLSGRYQQRQAVVTWVLVFSASAAAASVTDWLGPWARPILTFLTAGLSIWSVVAQYQKTATTSTDLHFRWNTLGVRYQLLWDHMYDPGAAETLLQLEVIAAEISKIGTAFPADPVRMGKWQDLVEAQHQLLAA